MQSSWHYGYTSSLQILNSLQKVHFLPEDRLFERLAPLLEIELTGGVAGAVRFVFVVSKIRVKLIGGTSASTLCLCVNSECSLDQDGKLTSASETMVSQRIIK